MSTKNEKPSLKPHFDDIQAHYDLSDEFFRLFLDETHTYSCAYFAGNHDLAAVHQVHRDEIFPGGQIPVISEIEKFAGEAGFTIDRIHELREHYAKTLDIWAATLEARYDEVVALQSEEMYERYMKYLTGCSNLFHEGYTDLCQFTLSK